MNTEVTFVADLGLPLSESLNNAMLSQAGKARVNVVWVDSTVLHHLAQELRLNVKEITHYNAETGDPTDDYNGIFASTTGGSVVVLDKGSAKSARMKLPEVDLCLVQAGK